MFSILRRNVLVIIALLFVATATTVVNAASAGTGSTVANASGITNSPLSRNLRSNPLFPQTIAVTLTITTHGGVNFATMGPDVTLEGRCSPLRAVHVNGSTTGVRYPISTTWQYTSALWTRDNVFVITDGLDSRTLTVYWDDFHGGTLTEDTTLLTSDYPYTIAEDIVVPSGITLTIEPSATLRFQAGRSLRVEGGQLVAVGTISRPVLFTRDGTDPWGAILIQNSIPNISKCCQIILFLNLARILKKCRNITGPVITRITPY